MSTLFLTCAGIGGTLLFLQFLAGLLGLGGDDSADATGGDGDTHFDGDASADGNGQSSAGISTWLFGVLSFKSIMTALTFFGLTGMTAIRSGVEDSQALGIALLFGLVALYSVAMLMRFLYSLKADGTLRIQRAIGKTGTVYLKIPGYRAGQGKVTLNVQNRSVEYQAITNSADIPTGSKVIVVAVHGADTLEVAPAPLTSETSSPENASHV